MFDFIYTASNLLFLSTQSGNRSNGSFLPRKLKEKQVSPY